MQKEHRDFPCGARAVGEVGEEEAGPTSKEPLLSSLPSTVLPALQKAGTVCYAGAGMYRVFHMASVQSYTGRFIFILPSSAVASCCQSVTPAPICPPPTWALHPTMSQSLGSKLLWRGWCGVQRTPWRREVGLQKGKTLSPLSLSHHPALQQPPRSRTLQFGSNGSLGP